MTQKKRGLSQSQIRGLQKILEHDLAHPGEGPDFAVVLPFDPKLLSSIFTEERLRLWAELKRSKPNTITEVAQRLQRNVSRVRQDLLILEKMRLAKLEKNGRQVRPTSDVLHIMIPAPE